MPQPAPVQAILDRPRTLFLAGPRQGLSRRVLGAAGAAVLMAAATLTPDVAMAQSYRDLLQAPSTSATQYGTSEALRATRGRLAQVVMVQPVEIENNNRATFGAVFGALLGAAASERIDDRRARRVAKVALSGAGAVVGQNIQKGMTGVDGVRITVLDPKTQELLSIPQANDQNIQPGDFVMLSGRGSKVRVVALDPSVQASLRAQLGSVAGQPAPRRGYSPR